MLPSQLFWRDFTFNLLQLPEEDSDDALKKWQDEISMIILCILSHSFLAKGGGLPLCP
jgi:hypothetical protein